MRLTLRFLFVTAWLVWALRAGAEEPAPASSNQAEHVVDAKRPIIAHVPVTTVLRGQPADITATITPQSGSITSAVTQIKLTLVGKPISFPMNPGTGDVFKVLIPVSAIEGISEFWYFIHSYDSNGHMADTIWHRVRIIEAGADSGAVGAGFLNTKTAVIGGGLLLAGGITAAVIAHNDDNGGGSDSGSGGSTTPPPTQKKMSPGRSSGNNNDHDSPSPPATNEPPCILTGNERVRYENLDPYFSSSPIGVVICGTCPDATISASATWGASDSQSNFNNPTCNLDNSSLKLFLSKPDGTPPCESQTISVYSNGQLIDTITWPSCFSGG